MIVIIGKGNPQSCPRCEMSITGIEIKGEFTGIILCTVYLMVLITVLVIEKQLTLFNDHPRSLRSHLYPEIVITVCPVSEVSV